MEPLSIEFIEQFRDNVAAAKSRDKTESKELTEKEKSEDQLFNLRRKDSIFDDVPPHRFSIDDITYEWMENRYYMKVNEKYAEESFGGDSLLDEKPTKRNATIKCMDRTTHFATLSKNMY